MTSTDEAGEYSLFGLRVGSNTTTALKPGYSFTPPSRTVSLPPDAAGQDFVAGSTGGGGFRVYLPVLMRGR